MWSKEYTEDLLLVYQQWPILYDPKNKDYLNKIKRNSALKSVKDDLKKNMPDISIAEIKRKIKTLRSQFIKERNKEKFSKKSGAGTDDVYQPSLWCYEQMQFLNPSAYDVQGESNMSSNYDTQSYTDTSGASFTDTADDSLICFDEMEKEKNSLPRKQKKKKECMLEQNVMECMGLAKNLAKTVKPTTSGDTKPSFKLGNFIGEELDGIDEAIFFKAKWKILDVVKEATRDNLELIKNRSHQDSQYVHLDSQYVHLDSQYAHLDSQFTDSDSEQFNLDTQMLTSPTLANETAIWSQTIIPPQKRSSTPTEMPTEAKKTYVPTLPIIGSQNMSVIPSKPKVFYIRK